MGGVAWYSRASTFCHLGQATTNNQLHPCVLEVFDHAPSVSYTPAQNVAHNIRHPLSQPLPLTGLPLDRLMEIESRLLPCGLHVVGRPPTAIEAIATLVNIAEVDRPSNNPPIVGLPGIMARSIGRSIEQLYLSSNKARPQPDLVLLLLLRALHVPLHAQ